MDIQSAELVASLKQEVAESKDALIKRTAQRMAMEAAEVQSLNNLIRALKEQNAEVQHARCTKCRGTAC